jgi:hypothetical protein
VLCAVQNGAEWRVCCVLCRMGVSGVCVVSCAEGTEWRVCFVLCRMRLSDQF